MLDLQKDALEKAGCDRVFADTASGSTAERPGLSQALAYLRAGDTLAVWRLDRLGRSLRHLIDTVTQLHDHCIRFISLTEAIDSASPSGKLVFHIFGALAEFERDLIRERTRAGLVAARARGRTGGHPYAAAFHDPKRLSIAKELYERRKTSIATICSMLGVSRPTFYRYTKGQSSHP